ncbi:MAG: hypothetical protein B6D59_02755 [Campylobacteraceae bacterium 4484_4]|nr:MAG: hypothetical protein B6D59_02755 [Campylobacteraceae bacterium 4484_4]
MSEFENLREEFENFVHTAQSGCETECPTDEELDEEYPDFVRELTAKMMTPAKCGIYFSKKDIREMGRTYGEMIGLKPRERMLRDLISSVHDAQEMERLFDIIKSYIDLKIATYDELGDIFGRSRPFFDLHKEKAEKLKGTFDRILNELKNESPL